MHRTGFTFKIKPELKAEYKKEHDNILPELVSTMKSCGIKKYSIFLKENGELFAYMDTNVDYEKVMEKLSKLDIRKQWQRKMDKFFIKSSQTLLGPSKEVLEEVFHLE